MSSSWIKLVLYGCGGHSRSVADIALANNPNIILEFIDPNALANERIFGFPVLKERSTINDPIFLAIGDNLKRKEMLQTLRPINLVSILSSIAHLGRGANIGKGCFIGNYCHIGPDVVIGKNTIINNAAIIEHESRVGEHCHIGPNATISGRCNIGDLVFIGVGATIKDKITICPNVKIGAGATVVHDIKEPGVYIGCPAKLMIEIKK